MTTAKILILDDNPVVLETVATLARELDFCVIEASSIEDASISLEAGHIDILLCDDDLGPGISGVDFILSKLVSMSPDIILMSGNPKPVRLPSNVRYLSKPFTIHQLQMALSSFAGL